jgi:hydrogenase expression/formation protein HypE
MVIFVSSDEADSAIRALWDHPYGREAAVIGTVTKRDTGRVLLRTALGAHRILDRHVGEQLPRIC